MILTKLLAPLPSSPLPRDSMILNKASTTKTTIHIINTCRPATMEMYNRYSHSLNLILNKIPHPRKKACRLRLTTSFSPCQTRMITCTISIQWSKEDSIKPTWASTYQVPIVMVSNNKMHLYRLSHLLFILIWM